MAGYGQFCPVAKATEIIGEKWTVLVLRELLLGTTRFNDFQRAISRMSPTLLTKRLRRLEEYGIVIRKKLSGRKGYEYRLTAAGKELSPLIEVLAVWGMRWARDQLTDDELRIDPRRFAPIPLPSFTGSSAHFRRNRHTMPDWFGVCLYRDVQRGDPELKRQAAE